MTPLASGRTFPMPHPSVQLDHILSDRPVATVGGGARAMEVSDHLALYVDLAETT
jgi:endonuclease/exonuclease/phosphatase family metal-dependent hydrolase